MERIQRYQPQTDSEAQTRKAILADYRMRGDGILTREGAHITASAMVCNPAMTHVMLLDHTLFQSLAWPGGHADGEKDLLGVALRETAEEAGIAAWPLTAAILSLDTLTVPAHQKRGRPVPAHTHYSVAFGLLAPVQETHPDGREATSACWFKLDEWEAACQEAHMIPIYRKILARMQAIAQEKQGVYRHLPGLLLPWYAQNARILPWRADKEPYHVWLSEIMLQQTRVEAVKGYYARFLEELPTIQALAEVREERLLKLWEGLGYYRRARNLQKAAQYLCENYQGQFPQTYAEILALPGVGAYTAGAIASICFDLPTPAVDGNVLRVLARVTETFACVDSPGQKATFTRALQAVYPAGQCGAFTQALMELGATVCLPNAAPLCEKCPLRDICLARRQDIARNLPVRAPKRARRKETYTILLLRCGERIAVRQRPEGLLAGLWELPNLPGALSAQAALDEVAKWGVRPLSVTRTLHRGHVFTHVEWEMVCHEVQCAQTNSLFAWVTDQERAQTYALPTAFRQFLEG